MTAAATKLVTPLTFQAITPARVTTDLFDPSGELEIDHVRWRNALNYLSLHHLQPMR